MTNTPALMSVCLSPLQQACQAFSSQEGPELPLLVAFCCPVVICSQESLTFDYGKRFPILFLLQALELQVSWISSLPCFTLPCCAEALRDCQTEEPWVTQ